MDEFHDIHHRIVKYLNPPSPEDDYLKSLRSRFPNSGQWIFAHEDFEEWQMSSNSILWMHGVPGCGKTVLSATIIDHLQKLLKRTRNRSVLVYYFFSFLDPVKQTVNGFLSSVLAQLCIRLKPNAVPLRIMRDFHDGGPRPSTEELFQLLLETMSRFKEVYLVVDALDECSLDERPKLFQMITRLQDLNDSNLHLLMTSRRNVDVQEAMSSIFPLQISIHEEAIVNDIGVYIQNKVQTDPRLRLYDESLKSRITEALVHESEGRFLWAALRLDQLLRCRTKKAVIDELESTTRSLGEYYFRLVSEITEGNKPLAIDALQWLTFSVEPLSVNALADAAVVYPSSPFPFNDQDRLVRPYDIVDILQNLVTLSHTSDSTDKGDAKVALIHQSLAEFLQQNGIITEAYAHNSMARSCLKYITYYAHSEKGADLKANSKRFPFLLYACKHWRTHARRWSELGSQDSTKGPGALALQERIQEFLSDAIMMKTWLSIFDSESPVDGSWHSGAQPLPYAVSTGIPEVVIGFLQQRVDVNCRDAHSRRPLHSAVAYGTKDIASILLDHGADPLAKDWEGKTPLLEAACSGRVDLTTLLYDNSDIKSICKIDESGSTILHSLAMKAPGHIFSMLIESVNSNQKGNSVNQQIDINHRDIAECTLLHRAVEAGNVEVINVLLSKGADLNAGDKRQDTPLHFAVRYDQEVAKETLIDKGAVLTMRNAENKTPLELSWAKKSLRWNLYQIDEALTRSRRMSIGAQAECHVLKKGSDHWGPDFIFRKTYSLMRLPSDERYYVHKALLRENQILQRLEHPFIVSYIGYEELESGEARLYLEYCEGGDLQTMHVKTSLPIPQHVSDDEDDILMSSSKLLHITSNSESIEPLKESEIWTMLYQLFAALAYLHYGVSVTRQGACRFEHHWDPVVHRDIKPHNVVLTTLPNGRRIVKLCDLGIARPFVNVNQSRASDRGSQDYSPPEVSDPNIEEKDRKWTSKGDVYSLGKTIDRLYKDFTPSGPLQDILTACQHPNRDLRPSSLDVLEIVHRHVIDPYQSLENELGRKPGGFILQAFLRIAKNLDATNFGTQTSIMQRKKLLARLDLLLKDGAEVQFQEHSRSLHLAILLNKDRMLDTLLLKGQNPDETWQNSGWTPLHLAAQQGNTEMTERLLEANADPATLDRHGYKAVEYASKLGHLDVVELFLEPSDSKPKTQVPRMSSHRVTKEETIFIEKRERRVPDTRLVRAMMATLT